MQTTTLYVELLIIGFQVYLWLGLFLASLPGLRWPALPEKLEDYALLVTLLVFGLAYFLGIVFDKAAHFLVGAQRGYLRRLLRAHTSNTVEEEDDEDHRQVYARILVKEKQATSEMLYARSKVRILRASTINVLLITIAAAVFISSQREAQWWPVVLAGLIFWLFILGAYIHTQRLYQARLQRFSKYLDEELGEPQIGKTEA